MKSDMTSTERVLAVIRRQEPDCVPTFEWDIDPDLIKNMTGGGTYEDFIEKFDLDAVMCGPDYMKKPLGNGYLLDEWGVTRTRGHEAYAMAVDEFAPIKSMADLEKWNPPDPYAPHRFETMKRRIQRFKGKRAIFAQLRDVWSNPRDLLGYAQLFIDVIKRPELVEGLVEKCINQSIALLEIAAELGAEVVMSGDDIADNRRTMISPEIWESLFMPHFRRWVKAIHDNGLYYWKHTDGNIMEVMDLFVEAGVDGIDPIDPMAKMDLATVKQRWGDKVAIKGNVDCAYLLVEEERTAEEVVEVVKECIRVAGPGGGYACSSSNSIHSGVRPDLYIAMLQAIREYGLYPLDMDRLAPANRGNSRTAQPAGQKNSPTSIRRPRAARVK
jgi:uroporphyrinogen decarboxylase